MKVKVEKVTREELRNMEFGESLEFELPNARACDNGKSVAYQMQNLLGCKFSVTTDYPTSTLAITKNAI